MTYAYPAWEFGADIYFLKLHNLQSGFQNSMCIRLYYKIMQAVS